MTTWREEIIGLYARKSAPLRADDLLVYARNKATALHSQFEWDDSVAAEDYRRMQARQLIRLVVETHPVDQFPMRTFVSLRAERRSPDGGYRSLADIRSQPFLMDLLLKDALADLATFQRKYHRIQALAPVMTAIAEVQSKHPAHSKARKAV